MKGFTLIELLIVIFIITVVSFFTAPSLLKEIGIKEEISVASYLKDLREDAVASKKEGVLKIDFKERFFSFRSSKAEKKLSMKDDELWELLIPNRGLIREGQVLITFPPFPSEDFLVFYLRKDGKDFTLFLNNITGEIEHYEGRKEFYD